MGCDMDNECSNYSLMIRFASDGEVLPYRVYMEEKKIQRRFLFFKWEATVYEDMPDAHSKALKDAKIVFENCTKPDFKYQVQDVWIECYDNYGYRTIIWKNGKWL